MGASSNTLLDRLVMRTAQAESAIEPPFESPFEPSEQELSIEEPRAQRQRQVAALESRPEKPIRKVDEQKQDAHEIKQFPADRVHAPSARSEVKTNRTQASIAHPAATVKTVREPYFIEPVHTMPGNERVTTVVPKQKEQKQQPRQSLAPRSERQPHAVQPDLVPEAITRATEHSERPTDREVTVNVTIGRLEIKRPEGKSRGEIRKAKGREGSSLEQFLSKRKGNA